MSQRPIDQRAKDPRRTARPPPRFVRRKAHHPPDRAAAGAAGDDMRLRGNRMARHDPEWPKTEKPDRRENRMDAFYERLIVRAATIDELLSADFEALPGQKGDADLAARRLAAWCRSCASGDWLLFGRRLDARRADARAGADPISHRSPQAVGRAAAMDCRRDLDRGGVAKRWPKTPSATRSALEPSRTLRVRTPAGAGRARSRGAALLERRCARTEQPDRIRPRQPAPFAAQGTVRPHGAGALRALRQGAEGRSRAARLRHGRRRSMVPATRRATINSSPK